MAATHSRRVRRFLLLVPALAWGCGSGSEWINEPVKMPAPTVPEVAAAAPEPPAPPPGALWRGDVNQTVEEGLGYFLQRVSVEPDLSGGRFQGFRITDLRPPTFWQGVDLKPGDVVTQVNGRSIERDIDAYEAFQGLRAAPALRVSFVRAGVKRELVYAIVERDAKGGPGKAAPAPPQTAPADPAPAAPAAASPKSAG